MKYDPESEKGFGSEFGSFHQFLEWGLLKQMVEKPDNMEEEEHEGAFQQPWSWEKSIQKNRDARL